MSDHITNPSRTGSTKRRLAAIIAAASVGVAGLAVASAAPAGAMPRKEFAYLCKLSGGRYINGSAGLQLCIYPDGTTLHNAP
ncbi:MAG: hypothetical protein OEY23_02950 [Acidimicrobiia bacterium]|nr:hypothetical protein [Acidimicrobiia bacterium]